MANVKFNPIAFLIAMRVQGRFQKVGVITLIKNKRDWNFSPDYGYVTNAEAAAIGEQVRFLLVETAAVDVDFTVNGEAFRVSRIKESAGKRD